MYQIIPKEKRFFSDMGEMNSHFLFNFAHYFDPENESFGNLRVFNDDFLSARSGFPMHPHRYYEIMTIVLEGTITHKDSLGNHEKIHKNEVQVTDAATGIYHSEFNEENEDLKLYQLWFSPPDMSPKPIYYTAKFEEKDFENNLFTLGSGISENENKLSSKLSVKRGKFDAGKKIEINFPKYVFLYVTSGKIRVNGKDILGEKYQLRSVGEKLDIEFLEKSELLVIESE
ncbi:MAG: pirin family protein [Candidatus Altimarinota bacterium]